MRTFMLGGVLLCLSCSGDSSDAWLNAQSSNGKADAGPVADSGAAPVDPGPTLPAPKTPVRLLPGLKEIVFWERTGGTLPTRHAFAPNGPQLSVRLSDPLHASNHDIVGVPSMEFYDVYYSDEDGNFEIDGHYLTISGVYTQALPAGGGLNLAEIELVFEAQGPSEFGVVVASYVALGDNASPADVNSCIDSDLQTHTTMGNTSGALERLRLTLGFSSTTSLR